MSNYIDTVKEKIADYIAREPVVETDDTISAYTLFSILKEENKKLRHVKEMEKALVDELNGIYPAEVKYEKKGLFKKKTKQDYFDNIFHSINGTNAEIVLCASSRSIGYINLVKDYNFDGVYSRFDSLTEDAYNQCKGYIEGIFDELEYIGSLYAIDDNPYIKIENEGFTISASFTNMGGHKFEYDISLNKNFDPNSNLNSTYYGQENNIKNVFEENRETILRNTPINIGDLSYMMCMLVLDYKNKENEKKIKKAIDEEIQKAYEKK